MREQAQTYLWPRYWVLRNGTVRLSDDGFLVDPRDRYGSILNPDAVAFDGIAATPCLVLLGEPGIGKSRVMQAERERLQGQLDPSTDRLLWLDLRTYSSEDRLVRNLFESLEYREWRAGTQRLHLFLDSLDECLLRIDTIAAILLDELGRDADKAGRLFLRIACRTAEWPSALMETGLRRLWGGEAEAVGVFELAPLRRVDVAHAVEVHGIDGERFFWELADKNAVPLAIKPVTLDLLIRRFRERGSLPSTQAELYHDGCLSLCEESSPSYQLAASARRAFQLTARQRLAVASRIAAITTFANRYAVWIGPESGAVPDEDVLVSALIGGRELVDSEAFAVDEGAIRETLRTGLFSARGPERLGWAHQTYAEFLAARYVVSRGFSLPQRINLLVQHGDARGKLIPQLQEAAAWMASMDLDVLRALIEANPEVMLRSDIATADEGDRAKLVGALLRLVDEDRLLLGDLGRHRAYAKLAHPDLAGQLRPYIADESKGNLVRSEAISIAEACQVVELQNDLVRIAVDEMQSRPVRVSAAYAVVRYGNHAARAELRSLALGKAGDDPEDELKGVGLQATWPSHLSAEELFAVLTPPQRNSLFGSYALFLSQGLIEDLQVGDLPRALAWVARSSTRRGFPQQLAELADAIMVKAWLHLDEPGVLAPFANIALARLTSHDEIAASPDGATPFADLLRDSEAKRRRVVEAILPMLRDPSRDWFVLIHSDTPLLYNSDLLWLIEQLARAETPQVQELWSHLIGRLIDISNVRQFDAVLSACHEHPVLASELVWLIEPIDINSERARRLREDHRRRQRHQVVREPVPYPLEQLSARLDRFDAGELAAWWEMVAVLTLDAASGRYGSVFAADLTATPGWATADVAMRERIVAAAWRYVVEQLPQPDDWFDSDDWYEADIAAYKALCLLLSEAPDSLAVLDDETWRCWTPVILAYPTDSSSGNEEGQRVLVRDAYRRAPATLVGVLNRLIDKENARHGTIFVTRKLNLCWDEGLSSSAIAKASDPGLRPNSMGDLLEEPLKRHAEGAEAFATNLLARPLPVESEVRERALVAARLLLIHTPRSAWRIVWSTLQDDAGFGRDLFEGLAQSARWGVVALNELSEDDLADLFFWLARQYPHAEDPDIDGVHAVSPRESVGRWRDQVLEHLKGRGTERAVAAMRRLIDELPQLPWLRWSLLGAQEMARRRSWDPPAPSAILALATDRDRRLVQDGAELIAVLVESLARLHEKLQGETPAAVDVWNEWLRDGARVYRPKSEEQFSDFVKRHLDEDLVRRGIVANREVQLRRGTGGSPGERTDIHIDAIRRVSAEGDRFDTITAIIEVKGNWHRELWQAMETQLAERYLADNQAQHGLYLVGWFTCPQWDADDSRKGATPMDTIDETRDRLNTQARTLSRGSRQIVAIVLDASLR